MFIWFVLYLISLWGCAGILIYEECLDEGLKMKHLFYISFFSFFPIVNLLIIIIMVIERFPQKLWFRFWNFTLIGKIRK